MGEALSPGAVHFIAGLPRSGSTLLAALLKQNPAFHVSLKSPVHRMVSALITGMSERNGPLELSDEQRRNILRSVVCEYYAGCGATVVFDSHRGWCMQLAILNTLFPSAKVICCLRNPAWIVDSTERLRQKHALHSPRMFPDDSFQTVYDRAALMLKAPYLGASLKGLRQAWFGEHAGMLIRVRYESLASKPIETLSRLYEL